MRASRLVSVLVAAFALVGRDRSLPARAGLIAAMLTQGAGRFRQLAAIQCEGGAILARRLQLGDGVGAGLVQALERWDGKGVPQQLKGDQLCLPIRIVHVAQDANIFDRMGGAERCMVEIKARRRDAYNPSVADALVEYLGDLLAPSSEDFDASLALDAEPQPHRMVRESGIDDLARAFADFTDLKSPFLSGHSSGVARLAELAAEAAGLSNVELLAVRRAGLLHDIVPVGRSQRDLGQARCLDFSAMGAGAPASLLHRTNPAWLRPTARPK